MTKGESLTTALERVSTLESFLEETGPKDDINIIDPNCSEPVFSKLATACGEAKDRLNVLIEKERQDERKAAVVFNVLF